MFESLATWMFMPGTWNDAMVYLGAIVVVGVITLIAVGD